MPSRIQFEQKYKAAAAKRYPEFVLDVDMPERKLMDFAATEQIHFLNLLPSFRQADSEGREVNYDRDSHWNAEGHQLAATVVAAWLADADLLLLKP